MVERQRKKIEHPAPEFTEESILAMGVVEELTRSGRVPTVRYIYQKANGELVAVCRIPPIGTQFGDFIQGADWIAIPPTYISPDGVVRGRAAEYEFSARGGNELEERMIKVAKEIGLIQNATLAAKALNALRIPLGFLKFYIRRGA